MFDPCFISVFSSDNFRHTQVSYTVVGFMCHYIPMVRDDLPDVSPFLIARSPMFHHFSWLNPIVSLYIFFPHIHNFCHHSYFSITIYLCLHPFKDPIYGVHSHVQPTRGTQPSGSGDLRHPLRLHPVLRQGRA